MGARRPGFLAFRRDPLAALAAARDEGEVVRRRVGPLRVAIATTPDAARDVLVASASRTRKGLGLERARLLLGDGLLTAEGGVHARHRAVVRPAFSSARLAAAAGSMSTRAGQAADRIARSGEADVAAECARLAIGVAGDALFTADLDPQADELGAALAGAMDFFDSPSLVVSGLPAHLPLPAARRFRASRARLRAVVGALAAARRREGAGPGDLLDLLVAARARGVLDDAEVRDEALTHLLAGHETVANALAWALGLLARHPHELARLHAETDAVLGGRTAGAADLPRLGRTRAVLLEAMRLYPPAWLLGRRVLAPITVGGEVLAPGTLVLVPVAALHRDPRRVDDPEAFRPERFLPGGDDPPPGAYLPFGAGPRSCIGRAFALQEATIALATLAGRLALEADGPMPRPLPRVTLRPLGGMPLRARPRCGVRTAFPHG